MAEKDFKVDFDPNFVLDKTMDLVIVPVQEQVGAMFLEEALHIIDTEHIIRTGHYRESIMPTQMPTKEDPTIAISSVDCDYAQYLEYGTRKMQAKAVFRRALMVVKERIGKGEIEHEPK